jgi:hypothetical protein
VTLCSLIMDHMVLHPRRQYYSHYTFYLHLLPLLGSGVCFWNSFSVSYTEDLHIRDYFHLRSGPDHWELQTMEVKAMRLKQCTLTFRECDRSFGEDACGHTVDSSASTSVILKHWLCTIVSLLICLLRICQIFNLSSETCS